MSTKINSSFAAKVLKDINVYQLMEGNIANCLHDMKRDDVIITRVSCNDSTIEERLRNISATLSVLPEDEAIITQACVYKSEYKNKPEKDKFNKLLEKEQEALESIGFCSINNYLEYEDSIPMIYKNTLGKEILEYAQ